MEVNGGIWPPWLATSATNPDYPLNFDIRSMTIEEVEMELMVKRDMAWVREVTPVPEEVAEPEEDFVQDNE